MRAADRAGRRRRQRGLLLLTGRDRGDGGHDAVPRLLQYIRVVEAVRRDRLTVRERLYRGVDGDARGRELRPRGGVLLVQGAHEAPVVGDGGVNAILDALHGSAVLIVRKLPSGEQLRQDSLAALLARIDCSG